jgi:predicted amidohydrolase
MAKSSNGTTYIGITYLLDLPDESGSSSLITNNFALITPLGSIAWVYEKAYPVPFVEV